MARYFTHYWENGTWDESRAAGEEGDILAYVAGNQFYRQEIEDGDQIYPVTIRGGSLYVLGRMEARGIHSLEEATSLLGWEPDWKATDYVVAKPDSSTPMRFDA